MTRIRALESKLLELTRQLEALAQSGAKINLTERVREINDIKHELELLKQDMEAEEEWNRQNIFDKE